VQISEGEGWRLQLSPQRRSYNALIGGQDWALELNSRELSALRRGVLTLLAQRAQLRDCLMPQEELDLELDLSLPALGVDASSAGSLFVALSGNAEQWSLRFVLTPGDGSRAAEGAWSAAASPALAAALEGLGEGAAAAI
jgi:hypothetical protein